jgi:hypothetical protein
MTKVSDDIDPHELPSAKLQVFWALDQLESASKGRFGYTEIASFLVDKIGVSTTSGAVQKCMDRAPRFVNKNRDGYRLMENGRKELAATQTNKVIYIEPGKPFVAKRIELGKVFGGMQGVVKICDPYVDGATLDTLFYHLNQKVPVRILTATVADVPVGTIRRSLSDLKKEGFVLEIRTYTSSGIHDRYILDDSRMWLSGNSLNHMGNKESFLVRLDKDILQSTTALFDSRWKVAAPF